MNLMHTRDAAFAFFKLSLGDNHDLDEVLRFSCVAAHALAEQRLQLLAQDVVSWVITRVGASRSKELVKSIWRNHSWYESDFSVLNTLMRGFLNVGMSPEALDILHKMRILGVFPSLSAITILLRGKTSEAVDCLHSMMECGCEPSIVTFNTIMHSLCREGNVAEARKIFDEIPEMGVTPNASAYNTLMDGYVKSREVG
ncbi:hypothetical protein PIB30_097444 [Stylosanthes scabra]|uniref:Pentatricopeptide repeat-containing protein n=1 Tax=Stylosanthes scabra TaxID=79078 RepID=A0ABU6UV69_9FABA|nr:hypothetical protein [Stylosanthes scabra]